MAKREASDVDPTKASAPGDPAEAETDAKGRPAEAGVEILGPDDAPSEGLQARLEKAEDRALRLQAELENYRKRAEREIQEVRRYSDLPLMRELLPVLDNMNRVIDAAEQAHDVESLLEGVKIVVRQLQDVLSRHHCVEIEALAEPFDPHRHEAMFQEPSDEHPPGTVLRVMQVGYELHGRVVRPSQVVVAKEE